MPADTMTMKMSRNCWCTRTSCSGQSCLAGKRQQAPEMCWSPTASLAGAASLPAPTRWHRRAPCFCVLLCGPQHSRTRAETALEQMARMSKTSGAKRSGARPKASKRLWRRRWPCSQVLCGRPRLHTCAPESVCQMISASCRLLTMPMGTFQRVTNVRTGANSSRAACASAWEDAGHGWRVGWGWRGVWGGDGVVVRVGRTLHACSFDRLLKGDSRQRLSNRLPGSAPLCCRGSQHLEQTRDWVLPARARTRSGLPRPPCQGWPAPAPCTPTSPAGQQRRPRHQGSRLRPTSGASPGAARWPRPARWCPPAAAGPGRRCLPTRVPAPRPPPAWWERQQTR